LYYFWLSVRVFRAGLGFAAPSAPVSSGLLHDIECSFEVVGDCGEVDLDGGFVDAFQSHSAQPVTSFPCPEYFFDLAPHLVNRLVPFLELAQRLLFIAAPHASGNNTRCSAFYTNGVAEVTAPLTLTTH
jgi:hypothetical protein